MSRPAADHPQPANPAEVSPTRELHEVLVRLMMLGVFLLNAALDLLFLGLWVGLQAIALPFFDSLDELEVLDRFTVIVVKVFFAGSTLVVIGVYTVKDLIRTVSRIWRMK
jgi:hypothetical protein